MRTRLLAITATGLTAALLGFGAVAWADSPHSPSSMSSRDTGRHDVGDDRGRSVPPVPPVNQTDDDPVTHDVGDDRGTAGHGADDPAGHDATDDSGRGSSSSGRR